MFRNAQTAALGFARLGGSHGLTKGLCAASVEAIAAVAGYTRGAFYSNFSSKEDLFMQLRRRDQPTTHTELVSLRSDAFSLDQIQQRTRDLYGQIHRDNESFMTWTEVRMLAARDTKFRPTLNALLGEKHRQITKFIEYFYERAGSEKSDASSHHGNGSDGSSRGRKALDVVEPNRHDSRHG
jgi:AcrR family transcriptional regulator